MVASFADEHPLLGASCLCAGDKVETAISIAFSCHLFTPDMGIVELRESDFTNGTTPGDVQVVS